MKLSFWATGLALPGVWNLALCGGILPLNLDQFGENSWCFPRQPGTGAVKGEGNTEGNLSFELFPKHIQCTCVPREKEISFLLSVYIVYLWAAAFPGTALGRGDGWEGGLRCFTAVTGGGFVLRRCSCAAAPQRD